MEIGFKLRTQATWKVNGDWKRENKARVKIIWYLLWPCTLFLLPTPDPIILLSWTGSVLVVDIIFRDKNQVLMSLACSCRPESYLSAELQLVSFLRYTILIPVWMCVSLRSPTPVVLSSATSRWHRKELWEWGLMRERESMRSLRTQGGNQWRGIYSKRKNGRYRVKDSMVFKHHLHQNQA